MFAQNQIPASHSGETSRGIHLSRFVVFFLRGLSPAATELLVKHARGCKLADLHAQSGGGVEVKRLARRKLGVVAFLFVFCGACIVRLSASLL